ncbi:conserved oligomeric Golgi complex subunit 8-like [Drosophila obscura]|uniref:conserved oligomeric Golgi complex subunit 8-like n=1 Tax=Drosophila obscura TaxID=7282 RepID=UPI001BB2102B|nr:conserved oligomeric Golgi complex subunit 8-like [Drosophila obscura]
MTRCESKQRIANINAFLETLEKDLQRDVGSIETVLGQCIYFGLSFSRVGADFRALMAPIFMGVVQRKFEASIEQELERFTLINKVTLHSRKQVDPAFAPPETLLDFYPLAALCNELRLCLFPNSLSL